MDQTQTMPPPDAELRFSIVPGAVVTIPLDGVLEVWSTAPVRMIVKNVKIVPPLS